MNVSYEAAHPLPGLEGRYAPEGSDGALSCPWSWATAGETEGLGPLPAEPWQHPSFAVGIYFWPISLRHQIAKPKAAWQDPLTATPESAWGHSLSNLCLASPGASGLLGVLSQSPEALQRLNGE